MKMQMYVIYDSKACIYNKPFYLINDQVALRSANDLVIDKTNEIGKHPEDFTMFCIGTYDDESANIKTLEKFDVICRFHELQQELNLTPIQPSLKEA